jgi:hypothetical protein
MRTHDLLANHGTDRNPEQPESCQKHADVRSPLSPLHAGRSLRGIPMGAKRITNDGSQAGKKQDPPAISLPRCSLQNLYKEFGYREARDCPDPQLSFWTKPASWIG